MQFSESTKSIFKALRNFQAEVKDPQKDTSNPFYKSKYVTLDGLINAVREPLTKHGLSFSQDCISKGDGTLEVITLLMHESGEWMRFDSAPMKLTKNDPQGAGSAITYGRRYSLSAALGVAWCDDDDANTHAQGQPMQQKQATPKEPLTFEGIRERLIKEKRDVEQFESWVIQKYGAIEFLGQSELEAICRIAFKGKA